MQSVLFSPEYFEHLKSSEMLVEKPMQTPDLNIEIFFEKIWKVHIIVFRGIIRNNYLIFLSDKWGAAYIHVLNKIDNYVKSHNTNRSSFFKDSALQAIDSL